MTDAPKTRWNQLKDAIPWSNLRASDKTVFRYLLDQAQFKTRDGEYESGDLLPIWTPKRDKAARETSISKRQVRYAVRHLEHHGWLAVTGTTGPGKRLSYVLAIGERCDCTGRVHAPATGATGGGERGQRETLGDAQRGQRDCPTGATFGHRSGATNGGNAAGQTARRNKGSTKEEVEGSSHACDVIPEDKDHVTCVTASPAEKQKRETLKLSPAQAVPWWERGRQREHCDVPGCALPGRLYPGGFRCDGHKP